jgi:hypothetical protein
VSRKLLSYTANLEPEQVERLQVIRTQSQESVARLVREGIDLVLAKYEGDAVKHAGDSTQGCGELGR